MKLPENLSQKLMQREQTNALRQLPQPNALIDCSSNDDIGFSKNATIFNKTHDNCN